MKVINSITITTSRKLTLLRSWHAICMKMWLSSYLHLNFFLITRIWTRFFHENKLGGTLSLNEHTRVLISLKKNVYCVYQHLGNCGFIMVSNYSRSMTWIYWKIITKLTLTSIGLMFQWARAYNFTPPKIKNYRTHVTAVY